MLPWDDQHLFVLRRTGILTIFERLVAGHRVHFGDDAVRTQEPL